MQHKKQELDHYCTNKQNNWKLIEANGDNEFTH